jgi:hypothetical protein
MAMAINRIALFSLGCFVLLILSPSVSRAENKADSTKNIILSFFSAHLDARKQNNPELWASQFASKAYYSTKSLEPSTVSRVVIADNFSTFNATYPKTAYKLAGPPRYRIKNKNIILSYNFEFCYEGDKIIEGDTSVMLNAVVEGNKIEINEYLEVQKVRERLAAVATQPASDFYSIDQIFQNSAYASHNAYSKKEILRRVQNRLKDENCYDGSSDGAMGPRSQEAVFVFQDKRGLAASGLLNDETLAALAVTDEPVRQTPQTVEKKPQRQKPSPPKDAAAAAEERVRKRLGM